MSPSREQFSHRRKRLVFQQTSDSLNIDAPLSFWGVEKVTEYKEWCAEQEAGSAAWRLFKARSLAMEERKGKGTGAERGSGSGAPTGPYDFKKLVTGCGSAGERGGGSTIRPDQNGRTERAHQEFSSARVWVCPSVFWPAQNLMPEFICYSANTGLIREPTAGLDGTDATDMHTELETGVAICREEEEEEEEEEDKTQLGAIVRDEIENCDKE
ncbi:hypothetical protein EYF80_023979 [Liparis tanakae]|uniref:Uncharacterized protein n=1 Tax=Liparis tanakae TaxID=230148 RepID=A0A4Z2HJ74_9TELE|nr:hypothetical protein EYF80_023979 [Liparis tanakae]